MAKKKKEWGDNSKKQEARERKSAAREEGRKAAAQNAEDSYWREAGEGSKTKTQQKREEAEKRRQEAATKRLEARKLAQDEEQALASSSRKAPRDRVAGPKVTQYQLQKRQEEQQAQQAEALKVAKKKEVSEEDYLALVDQPNQNRDDDGEVFAKGVDGALNELSVAADEVDRHPERRRKAAYLAFEDRELSVLKSEKPGLKQSQYKDMLFKMWQKSPENPMNWA